ncbi:uracil phosphoribosyltransferase [Synechococcales cyanobacterium C]|uniref:Uracil phosphoribosyltransferase n=1 Tax=Petrachloros mirabilis ULC683 TaxID=2781853 RepID=A0A8K1ZWA5_9CYAN|nr:uracil phosphoribosyltransferase [Petrachloros mirabilis]NCJ05042.1 uracil phosphoribosyltransferase [Petrachloros mirabilis ULC683]
MALQLRVYVPPHPLVKHWLAVARDRNTPGVLFRTAMIEMGRWLTYEALRNGDWLPSIETVIETPLALAPSNLINPQTPIAVVPILRAGLTLLEGIQAVLPLASTYHLGLVRNEETLQPSWYLNKLPSNIDPQTRILISEPMLATGGSIMAALAELTQRGADPSFIRIISIVAAPPALKQVGETYPRLQIYAATIDELVNEQGFIVPGLGDAGDRAFET